MKKLIYMAMLSSIIFMFGSGSAQAYFIYDWVTKGVISDAYGDDGFIINASLRLTDKEYNDRLFFFTESEFDRLSASISILFTDGSLWTEQLAPQPSLVLNPSLIGRISDDGSHLTSISYIDPIYMYVLNFIEFGEPDTILHMTAFTATGGLDSTVKFNDYGGSPYPVSGVNADHWNQYGVWALREEPPAVPEPGTFVLLGAGLGVLAILRRKMRG